MGGNRVYKALLQPPGPPNAWDNQEGCQQQQLHFWGEDVKSRGEMTQASSPASKGQSQGPGLQTPGHWATGRRASLSEEAVKHGG